MNEKQSQTSLIGIALALAAASLIYRFLVLGHLEQTSALFVGLPTFLAIAIALTPKPKTARGVVYKATTMALLLSGIVLAEGFVCIMMAAPLFYLVIFGVSTLVRWIRSETAGNPAIRCLAVLPVLAMSMEGVAPELSFNRNETVLVTKEVHATFAEVVATLASQPRFDSPLPLFLRLGFPRPTRATGAGLEVGDRRIVHFAGGEGKPGDLVIEVSARGENWVRFEFPEDQSHVAHWLSWQSAEVSWETSDTGNTRIEWQLSYHRELDPAWYFGPWQRYAARLTAQYLLDTLATP